MIRTLLQSWRGFSSSEAQQLDALLRSTALQRRQAMAGDQQVAQLTLPPQRPAATPASQPQPSTRRYTGFAAAAILLLCFTLGWLRWTTPTVHAGDFSQQLATVPGEMLRLINHAAQTSQTHLPQLSPLAQVSLPELPNWQNLSWQLDTPIQQEMNLWQNHWLKIKSRLSSQPQELQGS